MNVTGEVKHLKCGAEAKASLNRASDSLRVIGSVWYSDVKRDDLGMSRLKLG